MKVQHLIPLVIAISAFGLRAGAEESEASLKAEATVTESAAKKTALEKAPKGKIKEAELEKENGILVWSFDIVMPGTKDITEIQVNAKTGKIVSAEVETEADQAKEKAEDEKEGKGDDKD